MYKKLVFVVAIFIIRLGELPAVAPVTEKISVTTDRDLYIAGDRLYFSLKITGDSVNRSGFIYVALVNSYNIQVFKACLFAKANAAWGSIYLTDTLSTGIYQLVSYTNYLRNLGPAYFARKDIFVANRFEDSNFMVNRLNTMQLNDTITTPITTNTVQKPGIKINIEKTDLHRRQKCKFDISCPSGLSNGIYSVSIRQLAPITFHSSINKKNDTYKPCIYMTEKSGTYLQGKLVGQNNKPLVYSRVYLSSEDSVPNLQYVSTDAKGVFRFYLNPFYHGRQVIVTADSSIKARITVDDKYDSVCFTDNSNLDFDGDLAKFLDNGKKYLFIKLSYNQNYHKEYKINSGLRSYRPSVIEKNMEVVKPAEYIYLPNFLEISRELLPYLKIRQRKDEYIATVFDIDQMQFSTPFIFVDGVLIEHVRQIIPFDSKIISKIVCITNSRYFGSLNIPAILSITTTSREIDRMPWRSPIARYNVDDILPGSHYTPPPMDNIPANIPAFHQLLYWKPVTSIVDGDFCSDEFYTSDCTGKFELVVTGMDDNGNEWASKKEFNVLP